MKKQAPLAASPNAADFAAHRGSLIGALVFFFGCAAFGALEINPSNDTWIGLAAGREISVLGRPPAVDHFSYTAGDHPWINQNWLAHWLMFRLYHGLGPDSVLFATWLVSLLLFAAIAWAGWRRSGSWISALIAGGLAALGCRDFLAPRPATVGLACVALTAALLAELSASTHRARQIAFGAALTAVLLFWGESHGSFVFGYLMCALLIVAFVGRGRPWPIPAPVVTITLAGGVSAILSMTLGPFGLANFWHPSKVAASELWRLVPEWRSPLVAGTDAGRIARFFVLLAIAVSVVVAAIMFARVRSRRPAQIAPTSPQHLHAASAIFWYDIALCLVTLSLALWARRFIPLFYICAAPALAGWIRPSSPGRFVRSGIAMIAAVGGLGAGAAAWSAVNAEVVSHLGSRPGANLLDEFVRSDVHTAEAFEFLRENELDARIVVEWSESGPLLFFAPRCRVFIDGRAQQIYDERQFLQSLALFAAGPPEEKYRILKDSGTDAVLLLPYEYTQPLWAALERSESWIPALIVPGRYGLFLRVGGRPLEQLVGRVRAGKEWRPDSPAALLGRGWVWISAAPPNLDAAVQCWKQAVSGDRRLGLLAYPLIARRLHDAGHDAEARAYLESERDAAQSAAGGLSTADIRAVNQLLERLLNSLSHN